MSIDQALSTSMFMWYAVPRPSDAITKAMHEGLPWGRVEPAAQGNCVACGQAFVPKRAPLFDRSPGHRDGMGRSLR